MKPVCVVYITFYRGNKMPPFYIGKTTEDKVLKGYNGTVTSKRYGLIWRQERREHLELFKTVILSRFETDEGALIREEFLQRFFDVSNNPMFINMAISRKGFGGSGENHSQFGSVGPWSGRVGPNKGKKHPGLNKGREVSQESRQKMRRAKLGKSQTFEMVQKRVNSLRGKKRSEEAIQNMREAQRLRFSRNPVTQVTKLKMSASRGSPAVKRHLDDLHNKNRGVKQSRETIEKRSRTMTGKKRGSYKKRCIPDGI